MKNLLKPTIVDEKNKLFYYHLKICFKPKVGGILLKNQRVCCLVQFCVLASTKALESSKVHHVLSKSQGTMRFYGPKHNCSTVNQA
jgi:hypothetical protein